MLARQGFSLAEITVEQVNRNSTSRSLLPSTLVRFEGSRSGTHVAGSVEEHSQWMVVSDMELNLWITEEEEIRERFAFSYLLEGASLAI